jgi:hypothetical protein
MLVSTSDMTLVSICFKVRANREKSFNKQKNSKKFDKDKAKKL